MIFREDGTGALSFPRGSSDFEYVFDYTRTPVELNLISTREGKPYRIRAIVKYFGKNRMKIRTFFNEKRPDGFDPNDAENTIALTRGSSAKGVDS
jgi:hypothetical protein